VPPFQSRRGELLPDRGGGGHPAAPAAQLREHPVPHKHHLCPADTSGGHEQPARAALSETEGEYWPKGHQSVWNGYENPGSEWTDGQQIASETGNIKARKNSRRD